MTECWKGNILPTLCFHAQSWLQLDHVYIGLKQNLCWGSLIYLFMIVSAKLGRESLKYNHYKV